jgi:hypothetical protein
MDINTAAEEIGYRATRNDIKNMVKALSFHSWSNSVNESIRLEAGKYILKNWNAYLTVVNSR